MPQTSPPCSNLGFSNSPAADAPRCPSPGLPRTSNTLSYRQKPKAQRDSRLWQCQVQAFKNTHRRLSVYAFRLHFITTIPDDCRHLISAVTPHQDLSLFSLGPSQHGLITLLPTALPPLISPFPHPSQPASRSAHRTEAAEQVRKARHTVSSRPLASTKATAARGGHPISPTQHRSAETPRCNVARQLWDFSGFLICYQFGGCHAVFGFYPFSMCWHNEKVTQSVGVEAPAKSLLKDGYLHLLFAAKNSSKPELRWKRALSRRRLRERSQGIHLWVILSLGNSCLFSAGLARKEYCPSQRGN